MNAFSMHKHLNIFMEGCMNTHLKFIIDGQITFLPHLFQISTESHVVQLSQKETALLELLCSTPTAPIERSTIIKEIWNDQAASDIGLNKAILGLRRKFESLGAHDVIRTIPRVGYVLNVVATKAPFHTASLPLETKLKHKRHITAAFVLIVAILISITSITIFLNKQNDISFDEIDKGKNGIVYFTKKLNHSTIINIKDTVNQSADKLRDYKIFVSDKAISLLDIGRYKSSKIFIVDKSSSIDKQLSCVLKHMKTNDFASKNPSNWEAIDIHIYGSCINEPVYAGNLKIDGLVYDGDADTILQKYKFISSDGFPLFYFDRLSSVRITPSTDEKSKLHTILYTKSLLIKSLDDSRMADCQSCLMILNEFSRKKTNAINIDSKNQVIVSDAFGGILLFDKKPRAYTP